MLPHCSIRTGVLARNPSSVLGGIQLNGLPASRTVIHRRLFALSPRRTAVSPFPPSLLGDLARLTVTGWVDVPFLFWSQGSRPTPCGVADCVVDGVSSNIPRLFSGLGDVRKPPASSPANQALQSVLNKVFGFE